MGSTLNAVIIYPQRVAACLLARLLRKGSLPRRSFLSSLVPHPLVPSSSANLSQPPALASHVTHNHAPGVANSLSYRTNQVHYNAFIGPQAIPPGLHTINSRVQRSNSRSASVTVDGCSVRPLMCGSARAITSCGFGGLSGFRGCLLPEQRFTQS
jgi:hypothetical protein